MARRKKTTKIFRLSGPTRRLSASAEAASCQSRQQKLQPSLWTEAWRHRQSSWKGWQGERTEALRVLMQQGCTGMGSISAFVSFWSSCQILTSMVLLKRDENIKQTRRRQENLACNLQETTFSVSLLFFFFFTQVSFIKLKLSRKIHNIISVNNYLMGLMWLRLNATD